MPSSPSSSSAHTIHLFTDGACLGNPGPGGWAYLLKQPGRETVHASGGEWKTTNNRMELTAVIRGLEALPPDAAVELCADSKYVTDGLTQWMEGWKRRGWRKSDKKPVQNGDLWRRLDELIQTRPFHAQWTQAHAGHPENERCDALAVAEAEKYQRMGA